MLSEYVAIVPARGGSKGLARKNILPLDEKPLFQYAVDQGLRTVSQVVVSTDMSEILISDQQDRVQLYERPSQFAQDASTMDDVLRDVISAQNLTGKTLVLLQVTSPLRLDQDVLDAISVYETGLYDLVQTVTPAEQSILKWGMRRGNTFIPVSKPEYCFSNRQSLPEVFKPNGAVYVFGADWFLSNGGLATDRIGMCEMPKERSHDIDTLADFETVEHMLKK